MPQTDALTTNVISGVPEADPKANAPLQEVGHCQLPEEEQTREPNRTSDLKGILFQLGQSFFTISRIE